MAWMVFSIDSEHPQAIGELLGELIGSGFQNLPKSTQLSQGGKPSSGARQQSTLGHTTQRACGVRDCVG